MTKLRVAMVSRELGKHKGDMAHLIMDANMVDRAVLSAKMIATFCGHSSAVFDKEHEDIVSRIIDHIFSNMEGPAIDLLSDFRDTYVASGNRVIEMHLTDPSKKGAAAILSLTVQLQRVLPSNVRVSGIEITIRDKE